MEELGNIGAHIVEKKPPGINSGGFDLTSLPVTNPAARELY
jgi:hypothetical protein